MIGNDIVDLNRAKTSSNWRRRGWLEKVFSEKEQCLINYSKSRTQTLWRLWSMKESAYKCQVQQGVLRRFNPRHFQCCISDEVYGAVVSKEFRFYTKTKINPQFIHSTASFTNNSLGVAKIERFNSNGHQSSSEVLRRSVLKLVSETEGYPIKDLRIEKNVCQIPKVVFKNTVLNIPISLSHHGHFGAFVISA